MIWLLCAIALSAPVDDAREALAETDREWVGTLPLGGSGDGYGPRGAVVQFRRVIDGVPVDALTRVHLDENGEVVRVLEPALPERVLPGDAVAVEVAMAAATTRFPGATPHARLVWQPHGPSMRKVWVIDLDLVVPHPHFTVPRVLVDAANGQVIGIREAAHSADPIASVYVRNPTLDNTTTEVALPLAAESLSDYRIVTTSQCRDFGNLLPVDFEGEQVNQHQCTFFAASGPVDGNYLFTPIPYPEDPARDEDDFVAAQVYWGTHRALDWFETLGWQPVEDYEPALVLEVNYREPDTLNLDVMGDPDAALRPFNNAFFTGGYRDFQDRWVSPRTRYGQGTASDFGYDVDVVVHELGHFVNSSQNGVSWSPETSYGPSVEAGSINEGIADYFSGAMQGDPLLAEYALGTLGSIRDLSGDETCPESMYGLVHFDSLPYSQGIWTVRETLDEDDQRLLDQVVLDSLGLIGPRATFAEAVEIVLDLVEERLDARDALSAAWDAKGMLDCVPVVPVSSFGFDTPFLTYTQVWGSYEFLHLGPYPGMLQFQFDVPEGGGRVVFGYDEYEDLGLDFYDANEPLSLQIVGRSGDRLTWTREPTEVEIEYDGGTFTANVVEWLSDGEIVADAHLLQIDPVNERYDLHHFVAGWDVADGGTYTIQLVNPHERAAAPRNLSLTVTALSDIAEPEEPKGCGCASGAAPASAVWLLLALGWTRRRSSPRVKPPG